MPPRRNWNWDPPNPSPASECALPSRTKGSGAHSPAADDWRKSLALCLFCAIDARKMLPNYLVSLREWQLMKLGGGGGVIRGV